jgi:hypothetical protein
MLKRDDPAVKVEQYGKRLKQQETRDAFEDDPLSEALAAGKLSQSHKDSAEENTYDHITVGSHLKPEV